MVCFIATESNFAYMRKRMRLRDLNVKNYEWSKFSSKRVNVCHILYRFCDNSASIHKILVHISLRMKSKISVICFVLVLTKQQCFDSKMADRCLIFQMTWHNMGRHEGNKHIIMICLNSYFIWLTNLTKKKNRKKRKSVVDNVFLVVTCQINVL